MTVGDVINRAILLIDLEANTTVGQLASGVDASTPTRTTAQTGVDLYNEGVSILARTCMPLNAVGLLAGVAAPGALLLSNFVISSGPAAGGRLFAVRYASAAGAALIPVKREEAELEYGAGLLTDTGTPALFWADSETSIAVYPGPLTSTDIVGYGYGVPAPAAATTDTVTWSPTDEVMELLSHYVASKFAKKKFEDETLLGRAALWEGEFDAGRLRLWENIDEVIREAHFPLPPISQPRATTGASSGGRR